MTARPVTLAAAGIVAAFTAAAVLVGGVTPEERMISDARPSEPVVPETTAAVWSSKEADVPPAPLVVSGTTPAVRGEAIQATPTDPPPTTTTNPMPVDGDCDTWRPLLERYGLPWSSFERILVRESNCTNAHAVDGDDHSHGGLQVNILSSATRRAFEALGFDHDYLHTTEGAIHAAGNLHLVCGMAPWTTYDCGWPNGTPSRAEWP